MARKQHGSRHKRIQRKAKERALRYTCPEPARPKSVPPVRRRNRGARLLLITIAVLSLAFVGALFLGSLGLLWKTVAL